MDPSGRQAGRASPSTINDVAERAGVSVATVSRALRGLPNVSPATRERVANAAADLSYAADARASSLASGRTSVIGLVAPEFGSWYAAQTTAGVEIRLAEWGYDLLVYSLNPNEDRHAALGERIGTGRVDGLLMVDFFVGDSQESAAILKRVPLVTTGERIAGASSVTIDNVVGGAKAMQHLIDLGHRKIAYVGGNIPRRAVQGPTDHNRLVGANQALEAAGLDPIDGAIDGGYSVEGGRQAFARMWTDNPDITAVFCGSDEIAVGLIVEARRSGVSVPGDLSVVGFDGHDMAEPFGLTTIQQQVRANGALAADLLLAKINEPDIEPEHIVASTELVVRTSTSPAPGSG